MLDIVIVAPLNGWKQLGAPHWMQVSAHRFTATPDGQIAHYTDDVLRATVPPEGWDDFVAKYPDAAELVAQLRRPAAPATKPAAVDAAMAAAAAVAAAGPVSVIPGD